jgi:hypothetical protein
MPWLNCAIPRPLHFFYSVLSLRLYLEGYHTLASHPRGSACSSGPSHTPIRSVKDCWFSEFLHRGPWPSHESHGLN